MVCAGLRHTAKLITAQLNHGLPLDCWENGVYEEVQRPAGRNVIGTKWVLRVKTDAEGNLDKFKARVVSKGFRQVEGVDYDETFVVKDNQ